MHLLFFEDCLKTRFSLPSMFKNEKVFEIISIHIIDCFSFPELKNVEAYEHLKK